MHYSISLFLALICFSINVAIAQPDLSSARLLIADDFNAHPDFIPHMGAQCKRDGDEDCLITPGEWTNFYTFERFHPVADNDDSVQPIMQITDFQDKDGDGKSLTLFDESWGGSSRWGSDGVLAKHFGENVKDVYAEFHVKYQPDYRWHGLEAGAGQNLAKLFRLNHFDGNGENPFSFFAGGASGPIVLLDVAISGKRDTSELKTATRCDPQESNYKCGDYNESATYSLSSSFSEHLGDGEWHKVGFRAKINSAPGVTDGLISVWLDGELLGSKTDVPFLGAGADPDIGWNMAMIGGNAHNYPEAESARFEQWHSFDDVKIYALGEQSSQPEAPAESDPVVADQPEPKPEPEPQPETAPTNEELRARLREIQSEGYDLINEKAAINSRMFSLFDEIGNIQNKLGSVE